ncbi:MAG: DUF1015 domain-containing protein, partial [Lentisphaerae bacterium]|nr:DUF1015 domain-containing protein [Lentisphaerota bacterium]
YDVVDRAAAAALAAQNPLSFLHVSRPEIGLPETTPLDAAVVYARAADNFKALQDKGVFVREAEPSLYLYRLQQAAHKQCGLVACCHAEDYTAGLIKKHEKTRQDKEDDRTRHIGALRAHGGLVFLMYRDQPALTSQLQEIEARDPIYDFTLPDGVRHTVWRVRQTAPLSAACAQISHCYIADGHHRAASAARIARDCRAANPAPLGGEEYNWFPVVLFPASQLQILPYNRCVKDLHGQSTAAFLEAVGSQMRMTPAAAANPTQAGHARMYCAGQWYDLALQPERAAAADGADPTSGLDVHLLQMRLLQPILGIGDPRTDQRIDFSGGRQSVAELKQRVDSGAAAVAFAMFPVAGEQLMAIADAGKSMPPKSTWFEPKVRSGLLIHTF